MGLLSSVKKTIGTVKNKAASALSGLTKKVGIGKNSGMVAKTGAKVGLITAARFSPVGAALSAASVVTNIGKKTGLPIGAGGLMNPIRKFAPKISKKIPKAVKTTALAAGALAAVGGVAYLGEQVAEKLGIRGGAGFIGKRKRKGKKTKKYAYIKVRRNRRGSGRLTRSEESRLRSTARSYENSEGNSRRRKGKKRPYPTWLKKYMFKKGRRRRR